MGFNKIEQSKNVVFYNCELLFFDAVSLSLVYNRNIDVSSISSSYKSIFGEKENFYGAPANFYVNSDGTYTLIFEEIKTLVSSSLAKASLGIIGVISLDDKAIEIKSYIVSKAQTVSMTMIPWEDYEPLYPNRREVNAQSLRDANHYKSFSYIKGTKNEYILFNDLVENLENIKKKSLTPVGSSSESDAFVCTIKNGIPSKDFLFTKPMEEVHNVGMFQVADYDTSTGTYATLKLENNKGKKLVKVIWIKL